jgi:hypothetical protein
MEVYKRLFYYILHTFIECPDDDLEWYKNAKGTCRKCGREFFRFSV